MARLALFNGIRRIPNAYASAQKWISDVRPRSMRSVFYHFKFCIILAIQINLKLHIQSWKILKIWNSAYAFLLNSWFWRVLQTKSQKIECQMKKVFSIFWRGRSVNSFAVILYMNQLSYWIRLRLRPPAHSREIENEYFFHLGIHLSWIGLYRLARIVVDLIFHNFLNFSTLKGSPSLEMILDALHSDLNRLKFHSLCSKILKSSELNRTIPYGTFDTDKGPFQRSWNQRNKCEA